MSCLKDTDEFGQRMKAYEAVETARQLDVSLPIYARIDGRAFSRFTKGMEKPFDMNLIQAMSKTTKHLVQHTHARIGYIQSDEISLVYLAENDNSDIFFSGKIQKMASVLASMAAAKFATVCPKGFEDRLPHFDCRVFNLPSKTEAANVFLWRAMDAKKNAISMVAQSIYSPKQLHKKSQKDMLKMIKDADTSFSGFPASARFGTFVQRVNVKLRLTSEELEKIPPKHRPKGAVIRTGFKEVQIPEFNKVKNREAFIFDSALPVYKSVAA